MARSHELWQKEIYDSRNEIYISESLPSPEGFQSLLLTYREHIRMLDQLGIQVNQRLLDIGCSSGNWLHFTSQKYGSVGTGVDISTAALEAAKARSQYPSVFVEASIERGLPFSDRSFDFVISFDVLEHLENPVHALQEVFRVLQPGGRALFHIPVRDIKGSMDWIASFVTPEKFARGLKLAGHDYAVMRTGREYRQILVDIGFLVLKQQRYNSLLQNIFDYHITHRFLNRVFYVNQISFTVYHKIIAPFLEWMVSPDRILQRLGIGASCYFIVQKPKGMMGRG